MINLKLAKNRKSISFYGKIFLLTEVNPDNELYERDHRLLNSSNCCVPRKLAAEELF